MDYIKLPDTELTVMKAIWREGRVVSTAEVKEALEQERPWTLSALQTLLNRLIARGFLASHKEGKNRYYEALVPEQEYIAFENRQFLKKVNHSSLKGFVASLCYANAVSREELEELAAFIEAQAKGDAE